MVLLLFGVFAVCILSVLLTGADAYRRLSQRDQSGYEHRTASQYLTTRVRQADRLGGVRVDTFDGQDTLVLSEDLTSMRKKLVCPSCGSEKEITVKTQVEADNINERCPNCNEVLKEESSEDLVDELVAKAEEMNANVEFISTETEEGMQLFRAFGGIAAVLRYYVDY